MALLRNTAEGQADQTIVTTSNSGGGSGDQFSQVAKAGTNPVLFSTDYAAKGTRSYKIAGNNGDFAAMIYNANSGGDQNGAIQFYLYLTANPTVVNAIASFHSSGGGSALTLSVRTNGKLTVSDFINPDFAISTNPLPLGTWIKIDATCTPGTTPTNGRARVSVYEAGNTTAIWSIDADGTINLGSVAVGSYRFGKLNDTATSPTYYIDQVAASTGDASFIPDDTGNTLPVASAGSPKVDIEPYSVVTLSGTDSDSDGTVVSRAWRQISGAPSVTLQNANAANASYTAPGTLAGTTLTFGYKVTDNLGGQSPESTTTNQINYATERAVISGIEVPVKTLVVESGTLK